MKQDEVIRDQYKLLGVVETFLEMMRVSQKIKIRSFSANVEECRMSNVEDGQKTP